MKTPRRPRQPTKVAQAGYEVMRGPQRTLTPSMTRKEMLRPQLGLNLGMDRRP